MSGVGDSSSSLSGQPPVPIVAGTLAAYNRLEPGVFATLLSFTFAMIGGPLLTYFVTRYIASVYLKQLDANIAGAIAAVVVVQIVLGCFVWVSLREPSAPQTSATDKSKQQ